MRAVGQLPMKMASLMAAASLVLATTTPALADQPGPPSQSAKEGADRAAAAHATPAKGEPARTPTDGATNGTVTVHVDSPSAVTLEHRQGAQAAWEHVCNAPCDQRVSVNDEYRIVGEGLNPSNGFMLDATQGDRVTLNVSPASHSKHTTGMWVLGGGAALGIAGTIAIIAGSSSQATPGADGTTTTTANTNWIFAGTAMIVGGVVAAIYGGAMVLNNAHTGVNGGVATPEKKGAPASASVQLTADRQPTYHEARGPVATVPTYTVPLLSGTF